MVKKIKLLLISLTVMFILTISLNTSNALTPNVPSLPNPDWPNRCPLKVTLIIDHSNSIANPDFGGDPANPTIVKEAAKNFVDDVTGTGALVSVVSFWNTADTEIALTTTDIPANVTAIKNAIDAIPFFQNDPRGGRTGRQLSKKPASLVQFFLIRKSPLSWLLS